MIRTESALFTLFIAALVGLPPLAIDMSLPGLSAITSGLGVDPGLGSLTLTTFLTGFGVSQLFFGPLSDRFGRRPVLAGGLLFYLLGGLACALAPNFGFLLAARVVQGFGAAAGTVLAIAMVRDCFEGAAAQRRLAYVNAVMNVAPVIAPVIGSGMLALVSWRGIYGLLAIVGAAIWLLSLAFVPETIRQRNPTATQLGSLLRSYGRVLSHRGAIAHTLIGGALFANMFSFISGSPLVFIDQLGLSRPAFSGIFALTSGGLVVGALTAGRLAHAPVSRWFLPGGIAGMVVASLGLCGLAVSGHLTATAAAALLLVDYIAVGFALPRSVYGAIEPFPDIAGVASAANGAIRMLGGAVAGGVVTALYDGTAFAMTTSMLLFAAAGGALWLWLLRPRVVVLGAAAD
jgi:DHA1 family bicyclomycin/chloramphenicol resistance-like MFS transporter